MDDKRVARYRAAEVAGWRACGVRFKDRWVEVPKHGIRVRILEAGEGPAVLFVHGLPAAGSIWAPLVARVRGHRCLVLDRPGCGLSQPLSPVPATPAGALVDVQAAVLDALGIEQLDVVGSSFGGASVLWLARARPDRVNRIVLEGAPATVAFRPTPGNRILAAGPLGRYVARRRSSRSGLEMVFRQVGHDRLVDDGWPQGPMLDLLLAMYNDTDTLANETAQLQAVLGWRGFRRGALFDPADFRWIDRPTLWLWGTEDPYAPVTEGRAWAAAMPDATFELLDGAGHMPWLDDPEGHARRIERFLVDRRTERRTEASDLVRAAVG
jgi:pimeloyl-ACP methyl ester carboxylesterase